MRMKMRSSHLRVCAVMALCGCGRAPEPAAQQAALNAEAAPPAETPTPACAFSVDRAVESTRVELERSPMEERFEIRGLRVAEAELHVRWVHQ